MNEYLLSIPPEDLATIGSKKWKKKDAQAYFNWFMQIKEQWVTTFFMQRLINFMYSKVVNDNFF